MCWWSVLQTSSTNYPLECNWIYLFELCHFVFIQIWWSFAIIDEAVSVLANFTAEKENLRHLSAVVITFFYCSGFIFIESPCKRYKFTWLGENMKKRQCDDGDKNDDNGIVQKTTTHNAFNLTLICINYKTIMKYEKYGCWNFLGNQYVICVCKTTRWYAYHTYAIKCTDKALTIDGAVVGVFLFVQSIVQYVTCSIIAIHYYTSSRNSLWLEASFPRMKEKVEKKWWTRILRKKYALNKFSLNRNKIYKEENCSTNLQDWFHHTRCTNKQMRHTHSHKRSQWQIFTKNKTLLAWVVASFYCEQKQ